MPEMCSSQGTVSSLAHAQPPQTNPGVDPITPFEMAPGEQAPAPHDAFLESFDV